MLTNIAARISMIYFAVATVWIFLTDSLVVSAFSSVETMSHFQTFKGMIFVILTTVALFFIVNKYLGRLEKAKIKLEKSESELTTINENLSILIQDETQRRVDAEKAIIQQGKLALMGEMLGAISHHWRQPLNAVGLKIQDVYYTYENEELSEEYLLNFQNSSMSIIHDMSKTIDEFKSFFAPNRGKELFLLEDAIDKAVRLFSAKLANGEIEVLKDYDKNAQMKYFGHKDELKQALLNIISNASDSITSNKNTNQRFIKIQTTYNTNLAKIVIEDSGGGIPHKIRDRIYDPYFSTKGQGKGVGIGLYMSKEIIERQIGGKLYDEKGEFGAKFIIELPMINEVSKRA